MLDELFQDFRISVRGLLRTPLFAVTVILTLALGIGTAIFSIVDLEQSIGDTVLTINAVV